MTPVRIESPGVAILQRRRRRLLFGAAAVALLLLPLLHLGFLALTMAGAIYGSIFFFAQPSEPNFALAIERKIPGFLEVNERGVRARSGGKEAFYDLGLVEEGWIANHWGENVVLQMKGGDLVSARVRTTAEANAVLAAAKARADQRTLDVRLATNESVGAWVVGLATSLTALTILASYVYRSTKLDSDSVSAGSLLFADTACIVLAALALRCVQSLLPRKLSVGTDGLSITGGFSREFIPYADVTSVAIEPRGVRVERAARTKNKSLLLPCWGIAQQALHQRIREAMSVGGGENASEAKQKLLDRQGVTFEAWRDRLREMGRGSGVAGYRSVSIDHDELAQVLESSSAPPARRIAAALALSSASVPEVKARVRAVVDTCANEHLRIAMEKAAEGELEEAELERALTPLAGAHASSR